MEREITLSSFSAKGTKDNRPGDFTTRFNPTLDLQNGTGKYYLQKAARVERPMSHKEPKEARKTRMLIL